MAFFPNGKEKEKDLHLPAQLIDEKLKWADFRCRPGLGNEKLN